MTARRTDVFVLVHSPLVGPLTWSLVAQELRQREIDTVVPALHDTEGSDAPYWRQHVASVTQAVTSLLEDRALVLVGHSGAGPLLPAIGQSCGYRVGAYIFVDAALPLDGKSRLNPVGSVKSPGSAGVSPVPAFGRQALGRARRPRSQWDPSTFHRPYQPRYGLGRRPSLALASHLDGSARSPTVDGPVAPVSRCRTHRAPTQSTMSRHRPALAAGAPRSASRTAPSGRRGHAASAAGRTCRCAQRSCGSRTVTVCPSASGTASVSACAWWSGATCAGCGWVRGRPLRPCAPVGTVPS